MSLYPFTSFILSVILAQFLKPFVAKLQGKSFDWHLITASGGYPSSHAAGMSALTMMTGLIEGFDSTFFSICLAFSLIIFYDAANVRYYAGQNIKLTKRIIKDLKEDTLIDENEPLYNEPLKEVLGHRWPEVFLGGILGVLISCLLYYTSVGGF